MQIVQPLQKLRRKENLTYVEKMRDLKLSLKHPAKWHITPPVTQETKVGGSQVQGKPRQLSEILSQKLKGLGIQLSDKVPLGLIPSIKQN